MKLSLLIAFMFMIGCSSRVKENEKPLGATQGQAARQDAADGMSNPAVPANQLPPGGTPILTPTVYP